MWTKNAVDKVIEMLHAAPALWDIQSKEYRDRNKKFDAMKKMADEFGTSVDEIGKKIKSLKTQFRREQQKKNRRERSGAAAASPDKTWFAYNSLTFLKDNNVSNGSRSTMENDDQNNSVSADVINTSVCSTEPETETETDYNQKTPPKSSANQKSFQPPTTSSKIQKKSNNERVEEAYKFMKSVQQNIQERDHYICYGENVSSRMRNANRSSRAVATAKFQIDNILYKLEMGDFDTPQSESTYSTPSRQSPLPSPGGAYDFDRQNTPTSALQPSPAPNSNLPSQH